MLPILLGVPMSISGKASAKEKFETMEALKGKDYGKERQKYENTAYPRFQ